MRAISTIFRLWRQPETIATTAAASKAFCMKSQSNIAPDVLPVDRARAGYADQFAGGTAALRYRVDETLALQAGLKFEKGEATDALGR
jgi:hypothetical protein